MSEWKPVAENPEENGWYPVVYAKLPGWHQAFFDTAAKEWACPNWAPSFWLPIPPLPGGKLNDGD